MENETLISLRDINKVFQTEHLETWALDSVHLEIDRGEFVAITGPSGCGKSTLLSLIGLLTTATSGKYLLRGEDISLFSGEKRAQLRNQEIGFVFQAFNLIAEMTVEQNVLLPLSYRPSLPKAERQEMAQAILNKVEMGHRSQHYPSQLSGGQQQRVAIARALVGNPALLLADEPTGNLDSKNASSVMSLLTTLHEEGNTICMVSHHDKAASHASRHISLFDGRVMADEQQAGTLTVHGTEELT